MSERVPDEEGYEIEVTAAPAPPPRKRRAENPAVDEPIQSGEIVLPRSSIIRSSQSQPMIPAQAVEEPRPSHPPAGRRGPRFIWLLLVPIPIAGAVGLGFVKPAASAPAAAAPPPSTVEVDSVAQLVGTTLDAEAHGAVIRAQALASAPTLRAAILTDAGTLNDMARDHDIVFPSNPGDVIEVFQTNAGTRKSLLRIPADAVSVSPPAVGTARVEQRGDHLVVIADAAVASQTNEVGGEIALTAPIDLSAIQKRPFEKLSGVALIGFASAVTLGGGAAAANGIQVTHKVMTTAATGPELTVVGTVPAPAPAAIPEAQGQTIVKAARIACIGLALIFLLGFGISLRK